MTAERTDIMADAVERIRRTEPPADAWDRVAARHRRRIRRRRTLVPALVSVAIAAIVLWPRRPVAEPMPSPDDVVMRTGDGLQTQFPMPRERGQQMGIWPIPRIAVASSAPSFASTGGKTPIELGAKTPVGELPVLLHVWDWEKSSKSRPLRVEADRIIALTPDGKSVVCDDGRLIDAATGKVTTFDWWAGLKLRPNALHFSPDGKTLLAFEHDDKTGTARLIDFPKGKERAKIDGLWWAMFRCDFSADGALLALYASDGRVKLFDAATGKARKAFEPKFENSVSALAVSPDGSKVAGCCRETIRVWDAATGKMLCEPDSTQQYGIPGGAYVLAFSPDGKKLAIGGSQNLSLCDAGTGKRLHRFPSKSCGACHLRFDPLGKVITLLANFHISSGEDRSEVNVYPTVTRWDAATGEELVPKE